MLNPFVPSQWFWVVSGDEGRAWSSAAGAWVTQWPAYCATRIATIGDLDAVLRSHGLRSPIITAADVRNECQRRITAMVGAPGNLEASIIKQLNALMRAVMLTNNKHTRELTSAELAEEAALTNLANCIQQLRACSNAMEASPPANYTDDSHWTIG